MKFWCLCQSTQREESNDLTVSMDGESARMIPLEGYSSRLGLFRVNFRVGSGLGLRLRLRIHFYEGVFMLQGPSIASFLASEPVILPSCDAGLLPSCDAGLKQARFLIVDHCDRLVEVCASVR